MGDKIIIDEVNSIELKLSDRLDGPGSDGLTGFGRVWYSLNRDHWRITHFRSEYKCRQIINDLKDVAAIIEAIKDYE